MRFDGSNKYQMELVLRFEGYDIHLVIYLNNVFSLYERIFKAEKHFYHCQKMNKNHLFFVHIELS
jgi:hypothetical protein